MKVVVYTFQPSRLAIAQSHVLLERLYGDLYGPPVTIGLDNFSWIGIEFVCDESDKGAVTQSLAEDDKNLSDFSKGPLAGRDTEALRPSASRQYDCLAVITDHATPVAADALFPSTALRIEHPVAFGHRDIFETSFFAGIDYRRIEKPTVEQNHDMEIAREFCRYGANHVGSDLVTRLELEPELASALGSAESGLIPLLHAPGDEDASQRETGQHELVTVCIASVGVIPVPMCPFDVVPRLGDLAAVDDEIQDLVGLRLHESNDSLGGGLQDFRGPPGAGTDEVAQRSASSFFAQVSIQVRDRPLAVSQCEGQHEDIEVGPLSPFEPLLQGPEKGLQPVWDSADIIHEPFSDLVPTRALRCSQPSYRTRGSFSLPEPCRNMPEEGGSVSSIEVRGLHGKPDFTFLL